MKRKIFIAALAAVALAACEEGINEQTASADQKVDLCISLPSAVTKVSEESSPGDPTAVNTLQVFLFNEDGDLETSDMQESESIVLACVPGKKKVVALVNAPQVTGVSTYSQLTATTSSLNDNTIDSMVMEGETEVDINATMSITIPVSRLAAKVVLRQVINSFDLATHQAMEFSVTGVYLVNVAGEKKYLTDAAPTLWYNKMKLDLEDGQVPDFTYEQIATPVTLPYSSTYTADKYFYCYPNHTTVDSNDETWSERFTRLVVETTLDGEKVYYPISLSEVAQNTAYEITLKVTRPGSVSPDIPVTGHAAEIKVEVQDWITGELIEEVI